LPTRAFPSPSGTAPQSVTHAFHAEAGPLADRIVPTDTLADLVAAMAPPRAIILMVPAGQPVDDQLAALAPLLQPEDLVIDAGNANFHDTNRRASSGLPFRFMGIGVSGGEEGARHGPSIMAGGTPQDWARMAPVLQAIAARAEDGTPCADHMGEAGAGHFVKAVHNGIEYADMQMIAETYGVMRDGMGMTAAQIAPVFARWNEGTLRSYLVEISAKVAAATDPVTGGPLLDMIVDAAGQKGTGRWTAIEALHLAAPIPVIEAAVMARNVSSRLQERAAGRGALRPRPAAGDWPNARRPRTGADRRQDPVLRARLRDDDRRRQGIRLGAPDARHRPGLARGLHHPLGHAERHGDRAGRRRRPQPDPRPLLRRPPAPNLPALRRVVAAGALNGLGLPALSYGLAWFDLMRTARGTANMIQGQRDFFGLHGFQRLDGLPHPHGPWAAT
jgi:6-phosphogluconate dehydrogenase